MSAEGYISTSEAADRLGVTRQRVLQLIEGGRLPASLFANVYMIREADLKLVQDRPPGRPPKSKAATTTPSTDKRTTGRKDASGEAPSSDGRVIVKPKRATKKGRKK
jgi:excisionase family DNA binding protein